jgi:hypothetical protein
MEGIEKVIRFSQSLYAKEAVIRAAGAYAEHFRTRIAEDGGDVVVHIDGDDAGEDILDNFANHVLFEAVRMRTEAR